MNRLIYIPKTKWFGTSSRLFFSLYSSAKSLDVIPTMPTFFDSIRAKITARYSPKPLRFGYILVLVFAGSWLLAQNVAPIDKAENFIIRGATAHIGNGSVIENCFLVVEDGKITRIESQTAQTEQATPEGFSEIDGTEKHVYPGFIAPNNPLGLTEVDAVRSSRDFAEAGTYNPSVRALIAYNTDSELIPTIRNRGVLLTQVTPQGGTLMGQSSVMRLDGWNWEDAVARVNEGQHLEWPRKQRYKWSERRYVENEKYSAEIEDLTRFFKEAAAYCNSGEPTVTNLHFQSLCPLFGESQRLYIHVDGASELQEAVAFAKSQSVNMVVVGGNDAWRLTKLLKENDIPVLLHRTQSVPFREFEDVDQPFRNAKLLHDAGIPFAFTIDGSWEQRNLAFQAGQAIGYGLPYEAAVMALTLAPAKIMGIDKTYGSLETGKSATLFLSAGDALDVRTNTILEAFIDGKPVNLDDKQAELYRKFKAKYEDR